MEKVVQIFYKKKDGKAFKTSDEEWYNVAPYVEPYLAKAPEKTDITVVYEKNGNNNKVSKIIIPKTQESLESSKVPTSKTTDVKKTQTFYTGYPDRTAQIQRGNAGNMAAAVASGSSFNDVETATQFTLTLAQRFLEWLRME
jgi:hypothetical protein